MFDNLVQLIVLFVVIIDPMASIVVFAVATKSMEEKGRRQTALLAVGVATLISFTVLLLGTRLLDVFGISIQHFKIAGGVILFILGVEMALGYPLTNPGATKESSAAAIASIIATPLLTGPAAMTAIIVTSSDPAYGFASTALALGIVLLFSLVLLLLSTRIQKVMGKTAMAVMSTILGLITLAWGVKFILSGLGIG
jgi:multiple antibiotic resistance protein